MKASAITAGAFLLAILKEGDAYEYLHWAVPLQG